MTIEKFDSCLDFLYDRKLLNLAELSRLRFIHKQTGKAEHLLAFEQGLVSRNQYYQDLKENGFRFKTLSELGNLKPLVWVKANLQHYLNKGFLPIQETDEHIEILISNPFITELSPYLDIKVEKGKALKFVLLTDLEIKFLTEKIYEAPRSAQKETLVKKTKRKPLFFLLGVTVFLTLLNIWPVETLSTLSIGLSLTVILLGFILFVPALFDKERSASQDSQHNGQLKCFHVYSSQNSLQNVFQLVNKEDTELTVILQRENEIAKFLESKTPFKGQVVFNHHELTPTQLIHQCLMTQENGFVLFLEGDEVFKPSELQEVLNHSKVNNNTAALQLDVELSTNGNGFFTNLKQNQNNRYQKQVDLLFGSEKLIVQDSKGLVFNVDCYQKTAGLNNGKRNPYVFWSILNLVNAVQVQGLYFKVLVKDSLGGKEYMKHVAETVECQFYKLSYITQFRTALSNRFGVKSYIFLLFSSLIPLIYLLCIPPVVFQGIIVFINGLDNITTWWQYLAAFSFSAFLLYTIYSNLVAHLKSAKGVPGLAAWLSPISTLLESFFALRNFIFKR